MRIGCIVEARMNASRLPGKVLMDLAGQPSLLRQLERIKRSRFIDTLVVATTTNPDDDQIVALLEKEAIPFYRGSELDVLDRVSQTARYFDLDVIVEITGDCPLVDIKESDRVIEHYLEGGYDLVANNLLRSYPIGMDTIVLSNRVLQESAQKATEAVYREHVCLYLFEHPFDYKFSNIEAPRFLHDPGLRMTLDTPEDYAFIGRVYEELYPTNNEFDLYDIMKFVHRYPELRQITAGIQQKRIR